MRECPIAEESKRAGIETQRTMHHDHLSKSRTRARKDPIFVVYIAFSNCYGREKYSDSYGSGRKKCCRQQNRCTTPVSHATLPYQVTLSAKSVDKEPSISLNPVKNGRHGVLQCDFGALLRRPSGPFSGVALSVPLDCWDGCPISRMEFRQQIDIEPILPTLNRRIHGIAPPALCNTARG